MKRDLKSPPCKFIQLLLSFLLLLSLTSCVYETIVEEPQLEPPSEEAEPYFIEIEAKLSSIQDSLFSGTCQTSRCHDCCWNAAELDLTRGKSYADLVNVPSLQDSTVLRVYPGKPDSSYLIWKLEGHAGMQGRLMPIWSSGRLLDPRVIQVIRDWIEAGAKDVHEEMAEGN